MEMLTKEKLIEILNNKIELSLTNNYKSVYIDNLENCADDILSLHNAEIAKYKELFCANEPYPLINILDNLIKASEILLYKKDYDGNGYETIEICVKKARELRCKIFKLTKEIGGE